MESKPAGCCRFRPLAKARLLALLSLFAGLSQSLLAATPDVEGQWGPRIDFTTVPISAAVLPNGKLLIFSSWDRYDFNSGNGERDKTYANLYDPATGQVTEFLVAQTDHDMFCPGTAFLEDGRLLVNGGGPQVTTTSIYDFSANQWVRGESMSRRRWYNASTTLPTGGVFTLGGTPEDGVGELWTSGAGWSVLSGAPVTPMTVDAGSSLHRSKQHPKVLVAPNGRLFAAGPTPNMQWYDTANGGSVQFAGRRGNDIYAQSNVTAMFDVGKILTAGGNPNYDGAGAENSPSSANAYVIDITNGVISRKIASMQYGRAYANGVVLPDGTVLVIGGIGTGKAFTDTGAVFVPEMFDPVTERWTAMATQGTPRTYHSTAVLLPDGRVFSGGGGLCGDCGVNHPDGELYSPPYLFKGPRPVIQTAPSVVGYNAPFSITTTGSVARFTLVRLSSTTHTVNTDQRYLQLQSSPEGGGSFILTSPLNSNIAPPGYYMLFALSATGVPSVSKIIQVTREDAPVILTVLNQSDPVGASVSLPIEATSLQGRPLTYVATGLPPGLAIHSGTGLISGTLTTTGNYTVTVTVSDGTNASPMTFGWYVYGTGGSSFRYVRLEEVSEVNGEPWGSAAELNVLDTSGNTISRTGWVASADSAETASSPAYPAANAIDGNPATLWHTRWVGASPPPPHWLVVDMGTSYPVGGFRYLPRQDGSSNGRFAGYRFYVSTNGVNWGTPVAQGTFANTAAEKTVTFGAAPPNEPPVVTKTGNQTSVVGTSVNLAIGASDPNGDTLSYSATGLPAGLSINAGTGIITGTVSTAGTSTVTATVSDGKGGTIPTSFTWTVTSASTGGSFRYVRLEEVSEVSGKAFGSAAELNVLDTSGNTISRTGWVASADSAETASSPPYPAANAIDGNPATFWHTRWIGGAAPPPHWLVVDMGTSHPVGGFRYLPRQGGSSNGRFAGYRFYVSTNGVNWGTPVAQGTFANTAAEKTVTFSAAPPNQPPVVTNPGNQTSVVGASVNLAIGASDPNGDTLSYSATGLPAGLSINAGTGIITGTVSTAGTSTVTVTVSDDKGGTAPTSFTWTVTSASTGGSFRYVRLEEVSEVNGKPWGSAAEFNVLDTSGNTIVRTGWVASADSTETASSSGYSAKNAIDGNPATFWHTRWIGGAAPPPHWLVVDMGTSHPVGGFRYLPRQDGSSNGRFAGYRFYVSANGVDWGTPVAQGTFANTAAEKTVTFSAAAPNQSASPPNQAPDALALDPIASPPRTAGTPVSYTAVPHGGVNPRFSWSFGDGTAAMAPATTPGATHTFAHPGRYTVTVTATDDVGANVVREFVQAVHHPLTATPPTVSMSIAYEDHRDRVWNVNPDNDTATVFDALLEVKVAEIAVGQRPRSVAVAPDGRIWVANQQSASISIIAPDTLQVVQTVDLPAASQPYGLVFDSAGSHAYVALESMGLLLRLAPTTGVETGRVVVGPNPRHLSINADGTRVFVSRFITPPVPGEATAAPNTSARGGEVVVVDSSSLAIAKTVVLQHSEATDTTAGGRGVPNYLGPAVIAPDGRSAWVPSKQDNIKRGTLRDGRQLTFESTLRAISSRIDLDSLAEDYPARMDHDNSGVAATALFNSTSDYLFVALEASREVAVIDPYSRHELMRFNVGRAPQGLALSSDGSTLYVQNFMDRTVGVYDIETLVQTGATWVGLINTYSTVAAEKLSSQVLLGKQLFYDARDPRLARDRYISCAACHNDGGHDGRVWDLTGVGEGLRNTIDLRGRAGTAHGRLHWSSNFDEVQDFEQQIRGLAAGTGLMNDSDFNAGTRSQPLGDPKAGSSADLDALAAYVASLNTFAPSPHRSTDGTLTADAVAGETVFQIKDCGQCHSGGNLTDSITSSDTLHDIGTLKSSSGRRLGDTLTGIDTPTLRGVWESAPYLHDGSAATLSDAVSAHDGITVTSFELDRLSSYLQQLDSRTD